jgi:hypothetical protein
VANRLEVHTHFWWGRLKERQLRRYKPTREGIIKTEFRKVDWINVAQCRDIWPAVSNTVIPFLLYSMWEIS